MPRRPNRPVRNSDGPFLIESFLIAAVVSFLGIRAFLTLTGFPRVGGGELHIAHMLWGGALMLVAIMLLLSFLDRPIQHVSAVVAGLRRRSFAFISSVFSVAFFACHLRKSECQVLTTSGVRSHNGIRPRAVPSM